MRGRRSSESRATATVAVAPRARPTALVGRHRCPEPFLELQAKLLDQAQLISGQLHVALRDQNLAVTRSHSQKLHPGIMSRLTARVEGRRLPSNRPGSGSSDPEDVDRPGAGSDRAQAVPDRLAGAAP